MRAHAFSVYYECTEIDNGRGLSIERTERMNGDENGKATTFVGVFQRTARKEVLLASLFGELPFSSFLFYLVPPGNGLHRLVAARSGRQDCSKI